MVVASAPLIDRFNETFPRSRTLAVEARQIFPGGVTHDLRFLLPFPVYMDRAEGAYKWDVDGHRFIDFWSGHGAMLLGHSHPAIVEAVKHQVERATHCGGCHELEIEWGQQVQKMVPSAERVRFTASGTEATLMALRLARIFTGKSKFLKFAGHFHGWHDFVTPAADPPYDVPTVPGLPAEIGRVAVTIPPNDIDLFEQTLVNDPDIGAVILEPTGGHWGTVPIRQPFLKALREITQRLGRLLIFDEVITGFRVAPGGAQAYYDIRPDMTTLAKILAGGLPGGCVAGRADILNFIESRPGYPKMRHPGTYNANPLSAAAGLAALRRIEDGKACEQANRMARLLRNELNALFAARDWPLIAYGDFSLFRVLPNYRGPRPQRPEAGDHDGFIPCGGDLNQLDGPKNVAWTHAFRRALLLHGVDFPTLGGWVMAAHTESDIHQTVQSIALVLSEMQNEGLL